MTLNIKKYPNPILREKCKEIKEVSEEIKKLAKDMMETMVENQGVGLAAPQIGELKRIIVVHLEKGPQIFLNPKLIKKTKEKEIAEEGCLSFPGIFLKVKRAKEVEIEALNENGEKIYFEAEGLPARIFQHEIDHLDGILFIDRLNFWQKLKFKRKI